MSAKKEDFIQSKWRPMMAWMYMVTVTMDMVVFPVVWSIAQVLTHQQMTQWQPLTLQGAGLYHMAMGAILGVAAYGRTQEKIAGASVVTSSPTPSPFDPNSGLGSVSPQPTYQAPPVSSPPVSSTVSTSSSIQQTTVSMTPVAPDPSTPPPMSDKMAERLARFKK